MRLCLRFVSVVLVLGFSSPAFSAREPPRDPPKVIVLLQFHPGHSLPAMARTVAAEFGYQVIHIDRDFNEQLEAVYQRAERGEIQLDTIVAAGHSLGNYFWGDNGRLGPQVSGSSEGKTKFKELRAAYPNAASQVEMFFGMGCYTAKNAYMTHWSSGFPNATLRVGFKGGSPSQGRGGQRFFRDVFRTVARARQRAGTRSYCSPQLRAALRKLQMVRITTSAFHLCDLSYRTDKISDADQLRHDWEAMRALIFNPYLAAMQEGFESPPPNPKDYNTALRKFYMLTHDMLGLATTDDAEAIDAIKEQTIRLIYFDDIKREFWDAHAGDIAAARPLIDEAGFPKTKEDLVAMSRKDLLMLILEMPREVQIDETGGPGADAAKRLIDAARRELRDLNTPIEWIT